MIFLNQFVVPITRYQLSLFKTFFPYCFHTELKAYLNQIRLPFFSLLDVYKRKSLVCCCTSMFNAVCNRLTNPITEKNFFVCTSSMDTVRESQCNRIHLMMYFKQISYGVVNVAYFYKRFIC